MPIVRSRGLNNKPKYSRYKQTGESEVYYQGHCWHSCWNTWGNIIKIVCNTKMSAKTCCCLLQGLIWQITQKLLIQTLVSGCLLHMQFNFAADDRVGFFKICCHIPLSLSYFIFPFVEVGIEGLFLRLFNLRACIMKCGVEPWAGCRRTRWLWLCLDVRKGNCMWMAALQRSRGRGPGTKMSQSALVGRREMMESADGSVTHHLRASSDRRIQECQLQKFEQEAWEKQNPNVTWLKEEKQVSCWSIG